MTEHFIAGQVAGHEQAAANANARLHEATTTVVDDGVFRLQPSTGGELRLVVHMAQDFFSEYLPALTILSLLLLGAFLLTCCCVGVSSSLLRRTNASAQWRVVTQYAWAALLLFFGVSIAFGAVGINFYHILLGSAIVVSAVIVATSSEFQNFTAGIKLKSLGLVERHHTIDVPRSGTHGRILSIGLFTTELMELVPAAARADSLSSPSPSSIDFDDSDIEAGATPSNSSYVAQTVFVPNALLMAEPLRVRWHEHPTTTARAFVDARRAPTPQTTAAAVLARPTIGRFAADDVYAPTAAALPAAVVEDVSARDSVKHMAMVMNMRAKDLHRRVDAIAQQSDPHRRATEFLFND